jgi:hypothetical protein
MKFIGWVETRLAGEILGVEEVAKIDRCAYGILPKDIGLTLPEGKDLVGQVQRKIVQTQIEILSWNAYLGTCVHMLRHIVMNDVKRHASYHGMKTDPEERAKVEQDVGSNVDMYKMAA